MNRAFFELSLALRMVRLRLRVANVICGLMPEFTLSTIRARIYRATGMHIGKRVAFMHTVKVTGSGANPCARLTIGEDTIISSGVLFNLEGEITIGRDVNVSQFVRIYTSKHAMSTSERRFNPSFVPVPVVIGDGVWIGAGAMILPGVTIGRGSVVSAGSVVNRDVPPDTLVTGVPAVVVKELPKD